MARMLLVVYVAAAVPLSLLITCFLQATGVGAMLLARQDFIWSEF